MNMLRLSLKSTYSPQAIVKARFQGIGKTILYVFLLSMIAALPNVYHTNNHFTEAMDGLQTDLKDLPDFSITDGSLHTNTKKAIESQTNGYAVVLDPKNSYEMKQIKDKQNAVGFLKEKLVIVINGQDIEVPYTEFNEEITQQDILSLIDQMKTIIFPVLSIFILLASTAGKFIAVTCLALIGLFIRYRLKKNLSYKHLWVMSAYSITLATVFFFMMDTLQVAVFKGFLLYWLVNIVMLFLAIKETPHHKEQG
ncbi:DUF1189 domain-containing protein [Bacillus sp. CLL-7-23]|uniref:DUF1189 domain-containing protein n=1 Tax=Bacillus changyiensis TaxID=3004103 RepID=A0ABT4X3S1_9BACI|nr:DUF1189 domain-containing protein [Bacillus changyiensis]MDA7026930.1 DUF1189 domain-containing protein [Bacillus changyiensis]